MIKFLHLSDPHTHFKGTNAPLLERLLYIDSHHSDFTKLVSGDMTDDGSEDQYSVASIINNAISVPGNHDYGPLGNIYLKESAKEFDRFVYTYGQEGFYHKIPRIIPVGDTVIICLNSCKKTGSPFDFARGKIGWWQLWHLKRALDKYWDHIKIVMLHHHPFIHSDPTMELEDAEGFLKAIYGKVDILLFGHRHLQAQWQDKAGCKWVLASGAAYKEDTAKAILIDGKQIKIEEVRII